MNRKALMVGLALVPVVMVVVGLLAPTATATAPADKFYVCKYVGTPGQFEQLQTGQNPILVDDNAIATFPNVHIGDDFVDAQGHSLVIAGPVAPPGLDPEPVCPVVTPTTPPPPPPPPPPTTPPPVVTPACLGHASTGPWFGDPHTRIKLVGAGTFVISGGGKPQLGITTITKTLGCNEVYRTKYHVLPGHTLVITLNGSVVISKVAP